jgi:hypothetical protein
MVLGVWSLVGLLCGGHGLLGVGRLGVCMWGGVSVVCLVIEVLLCMRVG